MNRRKFIQSTTLAAAAVGTPVPWPQAVETDNQERRDIYQHVDSHQGDHLSKLQQYLRQPSISSTGEGIMECADMVRRFMVDLKFTEVELVQTPGHPVVWGHYDAGARKTLVVYGMYDVVPIFRPELWEVPPFEARIVDKPELGKALVARGTGNTKVPFRAFLNALGSILSVRDKLPINIMCVVEGEEELASRNIGVAIEKHRDKLQTGDACLDPKYLQNEQGLIELTLGAKGNTYIQLECSNDRRRIGPPGGSSSRFSALFGNPAWRLVEALNTLVGNDGLDIKIDGYMDMHRLLPEDLELIDAMLERYDPSVLLSDAKAIDFLPGLSKRDILIRYMLTPSFNISGIRSGFIDEDGRATRLPGKAFVKIDCRTVPELDHNRIVPLVRAHLDKHGFQDISIRVFGSYPYFKTSVRNPQVQTLIQTYRNHGHEPLLLPLRSSSGPYGHHFTDSPLSLPFLYGGLGHAGHFHAPNEYVIIEGKGNLASLPEVEKFYVDLVYDFAAGPERPGKTGRTWV